MSVVDRVLAAIIRHENLQDRAQARTRARAAAEPGDWLSLLIEHHIQIDAAFDAVRCTIDAPARISAFRDLARLVTAHAVAEESVIYPALAHIDERGHATQAMHEQAAAKLQMGLLEYVTPMSQEFMDALEAIREDVQHHVYEEEGKWFLEVRQRLPAERQAQLATRYLSEFQRFMDDSDWLPGGTVAPTNRVIADAASL